MKNPWMDTTRPNPALTYDRFNDDWVKKWGDDGVNFEARLYKMVKGTGKGYNADHHDLARRFADKQNTKLSLMRETDLPLLRALIWAGKPRLTDIRFLFTWLREEEGIDADAYNVELREDLKALMDKHGYFFR